MAKVHDKAITCTGRKEDRQIAWLQASSTDLVGVSLTGKLLVYMEMHSISIGWALQLLNAKTHSL